MAVTDTEFAAEMLSQLANYRQRWERAAWDTRPANRLAAEDGVREAYERAGLAVPQIVWCDSPMAIERARKDAWHAQHPGRCVKSVVVDVPLSRALAAVHTLPRRTYGRLSDSFDFRPPTANVANAADAVINQANRMVRWRMRSIARRLVLGWQRLSLPDFASSRWAPYDLRDALGLTQFAHDVLDYREGTAQLGGLWDIALNAGWIVPHERICWISDRWSICQIENGRLHNATGPALHFRDGFSFYFWKGVEVPAWMIDTPHRITASLIDLHPNPFVRRCMIEIMTPERYVATGAPRKVASDQYGTLWLRHWSLSDAWAAVEVINGTPNPDGGRSHYFLQVPGHIRSPLEAVAWTYGISAHRYEALMQRT
jgi:hypothetical protein